MTVDGAAADPRRAPLLAPTDPDHVDAHLLLVAEAELLDLGDLRAWLDLLAPEVRYTMPVQATRRRQDLPAGPPTSFHYDEDRTTLELRVRRLLDSEAAWSENPASRTRRFVSNLRVRRAPDGGLHAWTNLLLNRSRGHRDGYEVISAERHDELVRSDGGTLLIAAREIVVDEVRLAMGNLPFPI